jgi:hypothetical protein
MALPNFPSYSKSEDELDPVGEKSTSNPVLLRLARVAEEKEKTKKPIK